MTTMYIWEPRFYRMRTVSHSVVIIAPDSDEARSVAAAWLEQHNAIGFEFSLTRIWAVPRDATVIAGAL